ncbi:DUF6002 family protein [Nocardiopsis sp. NPDC049922]|uniref:DUF6002 family protein n=1 Tax=Nocardiopsis sp. NPDC049922 TaxID=3155157 RepID=UPI0034104AA0
MTATVPNTTEPDASANLLLDFYDRVRATIPAIVPRVDPVLNDDAKFSPGFHLPEPDDDVQRFFSVATAQWHRLADYGEHRLHLMDLTGNPGTGTTKTFASLLMVARAVEYIRRHGEGITIFSPTSANKGTALRDAVLGAIEAGLVEPEQLRVVILAPHTCLPKLRASRLSEDPELRALNPLLLYTGQRAENVKTIGREFVDRHAVAPRRRLGTRLWYSLELGNYLVADTARAFFEHQVAPGIGAGRIHAHAVSSAFGLLGYHQGRAALEREGLATPNTRPASLLVQHLGAPDMVLNLTHGNFDSANIPAYELKEGLYHQTTDARFPQVTADPDEILDPTFYTRRPPTSPTMNDLIRRFGGDGIVVSRAECQDRYTELRDLLAHTGCSLPADPGELREWSLVMALTGTLNAIDRGLIDTSREDVVVHGSGVYTSTGYDPLKHFTEVGSATDIAEAL